MKKLFTTLALFTSLLASAQSWNGSAAAWTAGDGTEANPYQLASAENIAYLAEQVAAGNTYVGEYFILTADIDMCNVKTLPIGMLDKYIDSDTSTSVDESLYFNGTIDGDYHKIINLNVEYVEDVNDTGGYMGGTGFLATMCDGTVIRRLTLSGTVTGGDVTGAFVGQMNGGLIEECCNEMTVNGSCYTGGLAGVMEVECMIRSCCNKGAVNGVTEVGGIVGQMAESACIWSAYNTAPVTASGFGGAGIVGAIYDSNVSVEECYNLGAIKGNSNQWLGSPYAITSDAASSATISNCFYVKERCGVDDPKGIAKTEEEMKSEDILSLLNVRGQYFTFIEGMNDGFPVLVWENNEPSAVGNIAVEKRGISLVGNMLTVNGSARVYDLSGRLVGEGSDVQLSRGVYVVVTDAQNVCKVVVQ